MNISEKIKQKKGTLIDVREAMELMLDGKIDDAKHIPMAEIPTKIDEIQNFEKPLFIFCRAGSRAENVKNFLQQNSINEVYNVGGFLEVKNILQS